jgi:transposase
MSDYTGKIIFIGIDVHKKTYSTTAVCEGEIVKKSTMQASPEGLLSYLAKYFSTAKEVHTAYEAGFSGFRLHRFLLGNGIKSLVVHPASIEIAARERVKNDKRDSAKIAVQLAAGRLKSVHIPTPEREDYRMVSRLRDLLVKDRRKKGAQIKMFLHQLGKIGCDEEFRICRKQIDRILGLELTEEQKFVLGSLTKQWVSIAEEILRVEVELAKQAQEDSKLEITYQSLPGIGPVTARILANELGDMSQFSNEKRLFSYTGLTPSEYSSGEHKRVGHISRQGKPVLRRVLVQAAWQAIEIDNDFQIFYNRISQRGGKKRAIVAVARRLIGCARTCIKENRTYRVGQLASTVT